MTTYDLINKLREHLNRKWGLEVDSQLSGGRVLVWLDLPGVPNDDQWRTLADSVITELEVAGFGARKGICKAAPTDDLRQMLAQGDVIEVVEPGPAAQAEEDTGRAMIINLTPHDITIYGADAPDVVGDEHAHLIQQRIPPSGKFARLAEQDLGGDVIDYGGVADLPPYTRGEEIYIVSLPVALAVAGTEPGRGDLRVVHGVVRNERGTVVGCRRLVRVVTAEIGVAGR